MSVHDRGAWGDAATTPADEGFVRLLAKVEAESGFGCGRYKERCLRRRVGVRLRARGVHTYDDYARVLDADPREWERLLDVLTINVSRLFRDAEVFAALAELVVPELWRRAEPLRVWSAGCAAGEEAYSLAALFHDHGRRAGDAVTAAGVRVLGSDIDRASLAAAAEGTVPEHALAEVPAELRERYFGPGPRCEVAPELRGLVRFERRDLLAEPPPAGPHHLVACRNVMIYLERDSQERLLVTLRDALAPGGYLVLGKVEALSGPARDGLAPVAPRARIYRRV